MIVMCPFLLLMIASLDPGRRPRRARVGD